MTVPTPGEQRDFDDLVFHWGEAYAIWLDGGGYWCAYRLAQGKFKPGGECYGLVALSADGLRAMIRDDYGARPVTR